MATVPSFRRARRQADRSGMISSRQRLFQASRPASSARNSARAPVEARGRPGAFDGAAGCSLDGSHTRVPQDHGGVYSERCSCQIDMESAGILLYRLCARVSLRMVYTWVDKEKICVYDMYIETYRVRRSALHCMT